jgi:type I restriction enzyme S subunit
VIASPEGALRDRRRLDHFVWYVLQTVDLSSHSAKAAVPGIDRNDIHVLPVAVPPPSEQVDIAEWLNWRTSELDDLAREGQRAIDLLQERRTALISAAVTGQIDVRGFVPSEAAGACTPQWTN